MDNDRFAYNLFYGETFVIKLGPGISLITKERKQVACMVGVGGAFWIVMLPCVLKAAGTIAKIVDMQGVEVAGAFF